MAIIGHFQKEKQKKNAVLSTDIKITKHYKSQRVAQPLCVRSYLYPLTLQSFLFVISPRSLVACETPPLLAVAVLAFAVYGEKLVCHIRLFSFASQQNLQPISSFCRHKPILLHQTPSKYTGYLAPSKKNHEKNPRILKIAVFVTIKQYF